MALPVASAPSGLSATRAGVSQPATSNPQIVPTADSTSAWTSPWRIEPTAGRTECRPQRHLAIALHDAGQHQAGEIRGGDQQRAERRAAAMMSSFGRRSMMKLSRNGIR